MTHTRPPRVRAKTDAEKDCDAEADDAGQLSDADPGGDAMALTVASLCSGYEATGLGLTLAGVDHRLAFVADPDPAASKALAHHHPDVPNLGDITRVAWHELGLTGEIDLLHAGFPCTDISAAGRRAGLASGTRSGVWANVADAIDVLRPRLVLIENVAALLSTPANRSTNGTDGDVEPGPAGLGIEPDGPLLRAAGAVLGDLSDLGYDAVWQVVSAASVGAPHLRKRVFILAWPAADPPRFGHRDAGPEGVGGIQSATVAGGARADGLSLLPTPRTTDSTGAGEHGSGGIDLRTAVSLLPTPMAADGGTDRGSSAGNGLRNTVRDTDRWGDYGPAIARWESVTGRPAPEPTEPGGTGMARVREFAHKHGVDGHTALEMLGTGRWGARLSPRFVEWLQGLPGGYVTDLVGRNDALRLLGNANPPQQYAAAWSRLVGIVRHLLEGEKAA